MVMCECYTWSQPFLPFFLQPRETGAAECRAEGLSGILNWTGRSYLQTCIVSPERLLFHLVPDNIQAFYSFPVFQAGGNETRGCQGEAQEQ